MKTEFTQGDWTVAFETDVYAPGPDGKILVATCDESNFIAPQTRRANARLIAAAPQLLDCLTRCLEYMELTSGKHGGLKDDCRTAIAKALPTAK